MRQEERGEDKRGEEERMRRGERSEKEADLLLE